MAISIAERESLFRGRYTFMYAELTLDSSYATSGESLAAADFGFGVIKAIFASHAEGYTIEFVRSSDTAWLVKVYGEASTTNTIAAEMVSGKDLSAVTIPVLIVGR
jgi:hypothetical protein